MKRTRFIIEDYDNHNVSTATNGETTCEVIIIDEEIILKKNDIIDLFIPTPMINKKPLFGMMLNASEFKCLTLQVFSVNIPRIYIHDTTLEDSIEREYQVSLLLTQSEFEEALNEQK